MTNTQLMYDKLAATGCDLEPDGYTMNGTPSYILYVYNDGLHIGNSFKGEPLRLTGTRQQLTDNLRELAASMLKVAKILDPPVED